MRSTLRHRRGPAAPGWAGQRPDRLVGAVLLLAALGAVSGCGSDAGAAPSPPPSPRAASPAPTGAELSLGFDGVVVPGDAVPGASNDGTASARITVATGGGGRMTWVDGPDGGNAVEMPSHRAEGPVPAAGLVVWPDRTGDDAADPIDPGTREVEFGIDFRADAPAPGRAGDDGDNLLQRGRYGDVAQFKLQLDGGVPSCRLAGSLGEVFVAAEEAVAPDHWYRLTCARTTGRVEMRLEDLEGGGEPLVWTTDADPGDVHFVDVPLSVGAKVTGAGRIATDSADQFHGAVDRVYVDVR